MPCAGHVEDVMHCQVVEEEMKTEEKPTQVTPAIEGEEDKRFRHQFERKAIVVEDEMKSEIPMILSLLLLLVLLLNFHHHYYTLPTSLTCRLVRCTAISNAGQQCPGKLPQVHDDDILRSSLPDGTSCYPRLYLPP
eukprot:396653-Hanusia_phi.AAC.1